MTSLTSSLKNHARIAASLLLLMTLSGCVSAYLDKSVPELSAQEKVSVANPKPVQLLYEFQTKGVGNGAATDMTRKTVTDTVVASGAFASVTDTPATGGALLHITINNVSLDDNAYAKGFATGLTLGLIGNTVGDGYVCTLDYIASPTAPKLTHSIKDAIYTSIGLTGSPKNVDKMPSMNAAAETMARRVVAHAVNDLAKDPAFNK